jgi:NADH-quinone oxidoreductase subunit J
MAVILAYTVATTSWETVAEPAYRSTAALLGEAFLRQYLLPFEVLSVLLLAVLIGAVVVATKELKSEEEPG